MTRPAVKAEPAPKYVSFKELADQFGMDRSAARRWLLKNGFEPTRVREAGAGSQAHLALTVAEADRARELRRAQGFLGGEVVRNDPAQTTGSFYVVRLAPDLAPGRLKLGFAASLPDRMAAHRTAAPTAELVKAWPCRRAWEQAAIAAATRDGARALSGEAFDVENVGELLRRCEAFFALMPGV